MCFDRTGTALPLRTAHILDVLEVAKGLNLKRTRTENAVFLYKSNLVTASDLG